MRSRRFCGAERLPLRPAAGRRRPALRRKGPQMREPGQICLGDSVQMRKPHACGANEWTIVRTGIDIRIRCNQCGRTILMPRPQFVKAAKKLLSPEESAHNRQETVHDDAG